MLVAITKNGERYIAQNVSKKIYDFFCPQCKEVVILKKGNIKIHHFAHKGFSLCEGSESESHMRAKYQIYNSLKAINGVSVDMELKIGCGRADIAMEFLCNGEETRLVIEIQKSSLSIEDIQLRTLNYYSFGYHVLWIMLLDDRFKENGWPETNIKFRDWEQFLVGFNDCEYVFYYDIKNMKVNAFKLCDVFVKKEYWKDEDGRLNMQESRYEGEFGVCKTVKKIKARDIKTFDIDEYFLSFALGNKVLSC